MLKKMFSRLARGIERSTSGKRRGNLQLPVASQIEQLEQRELLTNTVTANYTTPGGVH